MVVLSMVHFNLFCGSETKRMKMLSILVSIAAVLAIAVLTLAFADPEHCDRPGHPSC
jgi:hypothetical protein